MVCKGEMFTRWLGLWAIGVCSGWLLGQTELEKAAKRDRAEEVVRLLEKGADPNQTDPESVWEMTPLIAAARSGSAKAAAALLKAGADPNRYDAAGSTALIWSIKRDHHSILVLLLEAEAKTEMATDDGSNRTPLIWAILNKREASVAALLAHGADARATFKPPFGEERKSCLQIARERSSPAIVEMLEARLN